MLLLVDFEYVDRDIMMGTCGMFMSCVRLISRIVVVLLLHAYFQPISPRVGIRSSVCSRNRKDANVVPWTNSRGRFVTHLEFLTDCSMMDLLLRLGQQSMPAINY